MIESFPLKTVSTVSSAAKVTLESGIGLQICLLFYISVRLIPHSNAFLSRSNRQIYPTPAFGDGEDISFPSLRGRLGLSSPGQISACCVSPEDHRSEEHTSELQSRVDI